MANKFAYAVKKLKRKLRQNIGIIITKDMILDCGGNYKNTVRKQEVFSAKLYAKQRWSKSNLELVYFEEVGERAPLAIYSKSVLVKKGFYIFNPKVCI